MKKWIKKHTAELTRGIRAGLLTGFTLGVLAAFGTLVGPSCASVRKYDAAKGIISADTETIPAWAVDEYYEEMFAALKAGKKIKIVYIRKENPIAAWTLGAGMIVGGALIILGIAIIALSQGARLWRGLFISASGIASFLTFYILDKYLLWACIGFVALLIGAAVYFYCFAKGMTDKAIETNDLQKEGKWTKEMGEKAQELQGGLQDSISRRAKLIRKRAAARKAKAAKKIEKIQAK